MENLDLYYNQNLITIIKDKENLGYISAEDGFFVTSGVIGKNNKYSNFIDLLKSLQGLDIHLDNLYFLTN